MTIEILKKVTSDVYRLPNGDTIQAIVIVGEKDTVTFIPPQQFNLSNQTS